MIKDIADFIYRCKKNPSNWDYEFDKFLQDYNLLPFQDWSSIDPCFIISTGRTGTKFLAKLFNKYNTICSVHEPEPDFLDLGIDYARGIYSSEKTKKEVEKRRRAMCKRVKREKAKIYIESNNRLFSLIKPLRKVFDDPKIIHIVRDGRDYVRSGMSRPYGGYYSEGDSNPRLKASYFPDDPYYKKWEGMSQFEKICWLWQKKDGFILNDVNNYDNAITVRFENIFKEKGSPGIKRIANFLIFDEEKLESKFVRMQSSRINKTKEYKIPKWKEWSENKTEKFDEIAGAHIKNYENYGKE